MQRSSRARYALFTAVFLSVALSFSGCSGSSSNVIKIGADLPISGADASDGVPTKDGVQLAVDDANAANLVPGYTFQADVLDDAVNGIHDPGQGAHNVQALASDSSVVGIVGPFNSNVAEAEIPISNSIGIALISPANTNPTLTKGPSALGMRKYHPDQITYFRVCATDDVQGPVGADFAAKKMHLRRAFIIDDNETYGKGIADEWSARFEADGGTVLARDHLTQGQNDFHALLTDAASLNPDVIFYGGVSATGGDQLRKQMAGTPLATVTMFGADGIRNQEFLNVAGSMANDVFATVASVNAAGLPAAQKFLKEYQDTFHQTVGSYSAAGYVAATVLIKATVQAMKDNGGKPASREQVLDAIRSTPKFDSIIGPFAFDKNGDTTSKIISIYEAKHDSWFFLTQVTAK
jgi:branched-chain amino acid transport system substrate-binding protein